VSLGGLRNNKLMAVGSLPKGKSAYGAFDMIGNVEEWVSDFAPYSFFSDGPGYEVGDVSDPPGVQKDTKEHILRGGNYIDAAKPAWTRGKLGTDTGDQTVGFRCAHSL
jgi:formylglycine-generating enzyme required for sulfatase activity